MKKFKRILALSLFMLVSCTTGIDYIQNESNDDDYFAPITFRIPEELFFVGASKEDTLDFFAYEFSADIEIENSYINVTLSLAEQVRLVSTLNTDISTFFPNVLNMSIYLTDYKVERNENYSNFIFISENRDFLHGQAFDELVNLNFPQLAIMEYLFRIFMFYDIYAIERINFYVMDMSSDELFLLYSFFENAPESLLNRRY